MLPRCPPPHSTKPVQPLHLIHTPTPKPKTQTHPPPSPNPKACTAPHLLKVPHSHAPLLVPRHHHAVPVGREGDDGDAPGVQLQDGGVDLVPGEPAGQLAAAEAAPGLRL